MGNIKIVRGVFYTKLELEHAGVHARERIFIMYSTIQARSLLYSCKKLAILENK